VVVDRDNGEPLRRAFDSGLNFVTLLNLGGGIAELAFSSAAPTRLTEVLAGAGRGSGGKREIE